MQVFLPYGIMPQLRVQPVVFVHPLRAGATAVFPTAEAIPQAALPPAVAGAKLRAMADGPKPAVTSQVMNDAEHSMIAPDLPFKAVV